MNPFYFGTDERRLFGILSARPPNTVARRGVVLCNAFGREAIRAHRIFRVLADRLSRARCDVLRFDYYGTGDSAGDDQEVDLDGFGRDLLTAHEELMRRTGVQQVSWLGMRMGATVVQRAAQQSVEGLSDVVLWDPIVDGRDYLDLLRQRHLEWSTAGDDPIGDVPPVFRTDPSVYLEEAIGFPTPRRFCDQLRAFRLAEMRPRNARSTIVLDPGTPEGRALADVCRSQGVPFAEAAHGTDWTTEGDATALVPPNVMSMLVEKASMP